MTPEKKVIGLTEKIVIYGKSFKKEFVAKIDTGADKSSIDTKLAASLRLGPVVEVLNIKSASGNTQRPVIQVKINLCGKDLVSGFTLIDRMHMKYKILIGKNILKHGFIIDPNQPKVKVQR